MVFNNKSRPLSGLGLEDEARADITSGTMRRLNYDSGESFSGLLVTPGSPLCERIIINEVLRAPNSGISRTYTYALAILVIIKPSFSITILSSDKAARLRQLKLLAHFTRYSGVDLLKLRPDMEIEFYATVKNESRDVLKGALLKKDTASELRGRRKILNIRTILVKCNPGTPLNSICHVQPADFSLEIR